MRPRLTSPAPLIHLHACPSRPAKLLLLPLPAWPSHAASHHRVRATGIRCLPPPARLPLHASRTCAEMTITNTACSHSKVRCPACRLPSRSRLSTTGAFLAAALSAFPSLPPVGSGGGGGATVVTMGTSGELSTSSSGRFQVSRNICVSGGSTRPARSSYFSLPAVNAGNGSTVCVCLEGGVRGRVSGTQAGGRRQTRPHPPPNTCTAPQSLHCLRHHAYSHPGPFSPHSPPEGALLQMHTRSCSRQPNRPFHAGVNALPEDFTCICRAHDTYSAGLYLEEGQPMLERLYPGKRRALRARLLSPWGPQAWPQAPGLWVP